MELQCLHFLQLSDLNDWYSGIKARLLTFLLLSFQKSWIWWWFREVFPCWNVFNITFLPRYFLTDTFSVRWECFPLLMVSPSRVTIGINLQRYSCRLGTIAGVTFGTLERAGWVLTGPVSVIGNAHMNVSTSRTSDRPVRGVCRFLLHLSFQYTHSSRPAPLWLPFVFLPAKMCSSPPVRKWEECDLPRFLRSPCESAHIPEIQSTCGEDYCATGGLKTKGGDYQIAPRLRQSGGFCVTETLKGLWIRWKGCK